MRTRLRAAICSQIRDIGSFSIHHGGSLAGDATVQIDRGRLYCSRATHRRGAPLLALRANRVGRLAVHRVVSHFQGCLIHAQWHDQRDDLETMVLTGAVILGRIHDWLLIRTKAAGGKPAAPSCEFRPRELASHARDGLYSERRESDSMA
jgi:hypothetical protein